MSIEVICIALLLAVLAAQLLIYLRITARQSEMQQGIKGEVRWLFNQFEAYHYLRDRLKLHDGMPYTTDWSAAPDFLKLIVDHCLENKPATILECSSGTTTLMLARCCEMNGGGEVVSLENGSDYAQQSRGHLQRYQLQHRATIIDAPLQRYEINDNAYDWYDISELPEKSIDMLVIDGPPGFIQKHSRYPALPLLFDKLAEGCTIFMDDAAREDERELVQMWLSHFPQLEQHDIKTERGCAVLKLTR